MAIGFRLNLVNAQNEDISIHLGVRSGVQTINRYYGIIELDVSAPADTIAIDVYFNNELVHTEDGRVISWLFDTTDYSASETRVNIVAHDEDGLETEENLLVEFLTEEEANEILRTTMTILLTVFLIIAAVVILIVYLVFRKKKR